MSKVTERLVEAYGSNPGQSTKHDGQWIEFFSSAPVPKCPYRPGFFTFPFAPFGPIQDHCMVFDLWQHLAFDVGFPIRAIRIHKEHEFALVGVNSMKLKSEIDFCNNVNQCKRENTKLTRAMSNNMRTVSIGFAFFCSAVFCISMYLTGWVGIEPR